MSVFTSVYIMYVEDLNVITDLKCNKLLNVITFGLKCNKLLNVITFGLKCNKLLNVITFGLKCNNT